MILSRSFGHQLRTLSFRCHPSLLSCSSVRFQADSGGCAVHDTAGNVFRKPPTLPPLFRRSFSTTDPLFKVTKRKKKGMSTLMEKFLKAQNKKSSTLTHEVWDTMSCVDLAKVLNLDPDDVFELILHIDENLLSDERQPIRNKCVEPD